MLEALAYFAWVGPRPRLYKLLILCVAFFVFIFLLDMIPMVHRFFDSIRNALTYKLKQLRRLGNVNWKKLLLMIVSDAVLAFPVQRVFFWAGGFQIRRYFFAFAILFLLSLLFVYHEVVEKSFETVVFCFIMTMGLFFVLALPASCGISWDDETHFRCSLMLSHIMDGRITAGDYEILNGFPQVALEHDLYTEESYTPWVENIDRIDRSDWFMGLQRIKPTLDNWGYLPAAFGLFVGRALQLPYHIVFILGKLCNLLVYATLIYFAVKKIKSCKALVAAISMMPPCIMLAGSYSKDYWMIGFVILGFCYLFGELQEPGKLLELKDVLIMLGAFCIGLGAKAVYFPMILVCLFMPKSKFKSEHVYKRYIYMFIIAGILLLATFAVPYIASGGGGIEDKRGGETVDAAAQTMFILHNPLEYAKILLNFMSRYLALGYGYKHIDGMHYFGDAGHPLVIMLLLSIVAFTDRAYCDNNIKLGVKLSTLFFCFGAICLAATSMYVAFTPYMSEKILGCQYRYLFPVYFPSLFVLGSIPVDNRMRMDLYRGIVLSIISCVTMGAVWNLFLAAF